MQISLRWVFLLMDDVIDRWKQAGPGWQTRMAVRLGSV